MNTCTVTASADRSSVQLIRRLCRLESRPRVTVIGCLVQRSPERVSSIPGVAEVWDNEKKRIVLAGYGPEPIRSRAVLKVQDGCDRGCAYCAAATLRGKPASLAPEEVGQRFDELLAAGFHEVVLTGLNLGSYRSDSGLGLAGLLDSLLARPDYFRIRLASLEPDTLNSGLIERLADPRICPHFHLPLQSGDDRVLARMGRRCDSGKYEQLVREIRRVRPEANIGADVIAGLPGEDGESFERTCSFVDRLRPGYLHVFPYSPRPGTRAYSMADGVQAAEKKCRVHRLREISSRRRDEYRSSFVGKVRFAVPESGAAALTDNYIRVAPEMDAFCPGRSPVRLLIGRTEGRYTGRVVETGGQVVGRVGFAAGVADN